MSDLAFEILEQLKLNPNFKYSSDASIKCQQEQAIKELLNNGYITVKTKAIGFVIVKVL